MKYKPPKPISSFTNAIDPRLVEEARRAGISLWGCHSFSELCAMLPTGYYFCGKRLRCGNIYVDDDNHVNAVIFMLLKLRN